MFDTVSLFRLSQLLPSVLILVEKITFQKRTEQKAIRKKYKLLTLTFDELQHFQGIET